MNVCLLSKKAVHIFLYQSNAQFKKKLFFTKYMCKTHKPACLYLHTCRVCIAHYGNHAPLHKQLGAGIRGEIRPCWHGSFNEALSRKSRSEAAFILCHFSNNVCRLVCVCVPAHLFVCRETGVFSRFFFFLLCAHASACLHGFGLPMRFMVQFKEAAVIHDPHPSFIFDDLWVYIFVCFFFCACLAELPWLQVYWPLCFLFSFNLYAVILYIEL